MEIGNICTKFSVKSNTSNHTLISGYASVFDVIDNQNDIIEKGAFEGANAENIKLLWQHDSEKPIGVVKTIFEDNYGLRVEAEINNNTLRGKEAGELVKQKALKALSIGFALKEFIYNDQGIRIIKKTELLEVSIVTFPANPQAKITDFKALNLKLDPVDKLDKLINKLMILKKYN